MAEIVKKVGQEEKLTSIDKVVAFYKVKLSSNPNWAIKGLLRIYQNQTADEQQIKATVVHNGVGFVANDAEILSSFAKQYQIKGSLSDKQLEILYKKMPKYARQLFNCSVAEGKVKKSCGVYTFCCKKSNS